MDVRKAAQAEMCGSLDERELTIMSEGPGGSRAESDVYTILVIIATVVTVGATIYLTVRHQQLFGTWNPFTGA